MHSLFCLLIIITTNHDFVVIEYEVAENLYNDIEWSDLLVTQVIMQW